jgi:hypothetical protein
MVKEEASIYRKDPERSFTELSDDQTEKLLLIYKDMEANTKMRRSNEAYKLQSQNHVMVIPKEGKLILRVLRSQFLDSIDHEINPELAGGYVISNLDRMILEQNRRKDNEANQGGKYNQRTGQQSDGQNSEIGDIEDYKSINNRYLVWTPEFNFIMNGQAEILTGETGSPIPGDIPLVDISQEKDFTYWVKQGNALIDATLDYNITMSDIGHIVQNQGFAQAYLIADDSLHPDDIQIGPNRILKLPVQNPEDPRPEFGFAQPGSDIAGALSYADQKLMAFLTSRGLDPDTITTTKGGASNSGVQEFLRMMKHFKATQEDYAAYETAERKLYSLIKRWVNDAPHLLDEKYRMARIPDGSELQIQFHGPEMLQTEQEKIDVVISKMDNGLMSKVHALMELDGIDRAAAEELIKEIEEDDMIGGMDADQPERINQNSEAEPFFGQEPRDEERDQEEAR